MDLSKELFEMIGFILLAEIIHSILFLILLKRFSQENFNLFFKLTESGAIYFLQYIVASLFNICSNYWFSGWIYTKTGHDNAAYHFTIYFIAILFGLFLPLIGKKNTILRFVLLFFGSSIVFSLLILPISSYYLFGLPSWWNYWPEGNN